MLKSLCLAFLLLSLGLSGCNNKECYAKNSAAAQAWLAANPASGHMRVAGTWTPGVEGFGEAKFQQKGRLVMGTIGLYSVKGHVRGKDVYLVMSQKGWAHYSVVLKKKGNTLSGFYSDALPFSTRNQSSLINAKNTLFFVWKGI
jgi:hypothetical protein